MLSHVMLMIPIVLAGFHHCLCLLPQEVLSLFIASRSWLPSRPTTWLVAIFSFKLLGLGLFVVFLPMSLPGFLVDSGISGRGFRPNRCLLQLQLT